MNLPPVTVQLITWLQTSCPITVSSTSLKVGYQLITWLQGILREQEEAGKAFEDLIFELAQGLFHYILLAKNKSWDQPRFKKWGMRLHLLMDRTAKSHGKRCSYWCGVHTEVAFEVSDREHSSKDEVRAVEQVGHRSEHGEGQEIEGGRPYWALWVLLLLGEMGSPWMVWKTEWLILITKRMTVFQKNRLNVGYKYRCRQPSYVAPKASWERNGGGSNLFCKIEESILGRAVQSGWQFFSSPILLLLTPYKERRNCLCWQ